jgi:branched-chain amino acid transport system ATP-binding protein
VNALESEGLHTFYGKSHILHGVGLTVGEGEIVTLLGRNGAGKTTTLRSLMGLTHAREGTVRIFGETTTDWPPYRIAALGVGYVPEGRRIFANLTVDENLKVPLERPGPWTIQRIYELFPRLALRRSNKGRQLSGGEQEMLSIARALLLNPKLLLLDEPSQGLAPLIVQQVFDVIVAMRKEGMSVLLVEQNVRAAVEIADRAYVLDDGRVVYEGLAAEFRQGRGARPCARGRQRRKVGRGAVAQALRAVLVDSLEVLRRKATPRAASPPSRRSACVKC